MFPLDAGAWRKVRRTAEHEVEALLGAQQEPFAEVAVADLVALLEPVVGGALLRQPDALLLRLDGDEAGAWQPPRRNHRDRADPRTEIEHTGRRRRPRRAVPRGQHVVGREAVARRELKDPEVPADRVERLAGRNVRRLRRAG